MINAISHIVATLGYTGYLPVAPGTFGTALGLLAVFFVQPGDTLLLGSLVLLFISGTVASHYTEKILGKDSGHIVIDEFCGYMLSVLFIPRTAGYLFAAFLLFRVFDILKPPPIRAIERKVAGGLGVMADDMLAGIYTNICLQLWNYLMGG